MKTNMIAVAVLAFFMLTICINQSQMFMSRRHSRRIRPFGFMTNTAKVTPIRDGKGYHCLGFNADRTCLGKCNLLGLKLEKKYPSSNVDDYHYDYGENAEIEYRSSGDEYENKFMSGIEYHGDDYRGKFMSGIDYPESGDYRSKFMSGIEYPGDDYENKFMSGTQFPQEEINFRLEEEYHKIIGQCLPTDCRCVGDFRSSRRKIELTSLDHMLK